MITTQFYNLSLLISVTAFIYSYILTQPGEIFSWLYSKLNILFKMIIDILMEKARIHYSKL